jgi:hypothetical protein
MLSNLSDLLMSRVEPATSVPQVAIQQSVAQPIPAQGAPIQQAQYLQTTDMGKPKKTPQAVLDWLNQMENQTGYFAPEAEPVAIQSKSPKVEPGPIWGEYKTKLGGARILEGIRMPDGTIDTSNPDVGLVDYGTSMNPSGASQNKTRMSRATKNEAGNWVYRNPVNPNKTHEYSRVGGESEVTKKPVVDYGIEGKWSYENLPASEQIKYNADQEKWKQYYKDKAKKK